MEIENLNSGKRRRWKWNRRVAKEVSGRGIVQDFCADGEAEGGREKQRQV
jgi:hypothetical protein